MSEKVLNFTDKWARKAKLENTPKECLNCGNKIPFKPLVLKSGQKALKSEDHGCPEEYTQYIFIYED